MRIEKQYELDFLNEWEKAKKYVKFGGMLYIKNIKCAHNLKKVYFEFRKWAQDNEVILYFQNKHISINKLDELIEIYQNNYQKEIELRQREGITKALEKKYKGEGDYGRPKVILPDDFEAQIIDLITNKKRLGDYRRKIKMKSSTFYKYVNIIKKYH